MKPFSQWSEEDRYAVSWAAAISRTLRESCGLPLRPLFHWGERR
jgi:hypothetical protein